MALVGSVAVAGSLAVLPVAEGCPDCAFSKMDCSSEANFCRPDPAVEVRAEVAEFVAVLELADVLVALSGSVCEAALDARWWW